MTALDTNVLLYSCDRADAERQNKALAVISEAKDGVLLWQVACEFVAASRKLADQGFAPPDAWDRLEDFLTLFPLVLPSARVLGHARQLHLESGWSFWDAMIAAACLDCGATRLYSEDLPGRVLPGLEIINPSAAQAR
jgi:predicted nucleic acid-binding protein